MFKRLKQKLYRNDFLKNIMVLLSGSSLALLIPFIITPILTRFFTPEDFGLWGTYSAIVAVCAISVVTKSFQDDSIITVRNPANNNHRN